MAGITTKMALVTVVYTFLANCSDNTALLLFGACSTSGCVVTVDNCSINRPQFNTSVLNVTGKYRRVAGTVECAGLNSGQIQGSATCKVKVVYTSYNVGNCTTRVTTPDWTVRGSCDVDKIYTSDGDYNCEWQQKDQTTVPGQMSLYPFTDSGTGQEYNRMTCFFTAPMLTTDGTYDYILTIDPRNNPDETHKGQSIDIRSPKGPPVLHNCPHDVVEGDNVSCTCQASASDPPALVTWSSYSGDAVSNTALLPLHSVHTALGGHSSTCSQFWAGFDTTHKKETNYTINVMYPPPSPPVIQGTTNYTAGDYVNLTCTMTGGNPPVTSVTFYCGNHSDCDDVTSTAEGQTAVTSAAVVSSLTARDSGSVCRCSGVWSARPSLYATTSTVTITVHGGSAKNNDDESSELRMIAGVVGGVALVIIIVLVIVVVLLVKRRCEPLYAKPTAIRHGQGAEHTYTELDHNQHNLHAPRATQPEASTGENHQYVNTTTATNTQQDVAEEHYEIPATSRQQSSSDGQYENTTGCKQQFSSGHEYENTTACEQPSSSGHVYENPN